VADSSAHLPAQAHAEVILYRISSLIGREEDPRTALEEILRALVTFFHATSGSIALVNPDSGKLEIEVQFGLPGDYEEVSLRLGQGITGWVAFHAKAQLVRDVSADPRYIPLRPDVRCEMAAPMEDNGRAIGVINLDSTSVAGFSEANFELFQRCTAEATLVMTRLWQLRQLREKARQFESLLGTGQMLVGKLQQDELFAALALDVRRVAQGRASALFVHDRNAQTVRLAAFSSDDGLSPPPAEEDLALDSCLISGVIHTRKQIDFPNIQGPEFYDLFDVPRDPHLRSVLCTPMLIDNEVIGVISVFTDHLHRFNNDEKRLASALAGLGAVALQNVRLYERVFQSEESLRKNEQLTTLGLLAAEIAHEIRNPLTVIKLLFGTLGLDFEEGDPRRTDMRVIGEKLDQLEAIVTRVLHFAKAPSSVHSRWSIQDIVSDTLVLIRLKLAQGNIRLIFAPPAKPIVVDVHKGQLQQVLLNLLINSTQAMPDGGTIHLSCEVEKRESHRVLHVDISDSGRGIPTELQGRIFDSFLSGRPDGTGLGLAIAKRILVSHHGDICLRETGPSGTTMRLTLPVVLV
jgi:signal transduction histidine kinase